MTEHAEGRRFIGDELWIAVPVTATDSNSCKEREKEENEWKLPNQILFYDLTSDFVL